MAKTMQENGEKKKYSVPVLIINIIVTALFLFVFVCLCTVMIQSLAGKEPSLFGYRSMVVLTDSMTGTYDKGDVIIVRVTDSEKLLEDPSVIEEGDVVTFVAPEGFGTVDGYTVTHRVEEAPYLAEDGNWYIRTKGDAAADVDKTPIPLENVTGFVLGKSEALAGLQNVLRSKAGFLLVIVLPLVLIAVWQIAVFAFARNKSRKVAEGAQEPEGSERAESERIEELKKQAVEEYLRDKEKEKNLSSDDPQKGDGQRP